MSGGNVSGYGAGGGGGGATHLYGVSLSVGGSPAPQMLPKALIATRAVQTKQGWVGQLIVDEQIIWESSPVVAHDEDDDRPEKLAEQLATERVIKAVVKMLNAVK